MAAWITSLERERTWTCYITNVGCFLFIGRASVFRRRLGFVSRQDLCTSDLDTWTHVAGRRQMVGGSLGPMESMNWVNREPDDPAGCPPAAEL